VTANANHAIALIPSGGAFYQELVHCSEGFRKASAFTKWKPHSQPTACSCMEYNLERRWLLLLYAGAVQVPQTMGGAAALNRSWGLPSGVLRIEWGHCVGGLHSCGGSAEGVGAVGRKCRRQPRGAVPRRAGPGAERRPQAPERGRAQPHHRCRRLRVRRRRSQQVCTESLAPHPELLFTAAPGAKCVPITRGRRGRLHRSVLGLIACVGFCSLGETPRSSLSMQDLMWHAESSLALSRVNGNLNLSRAIGDLKYKGNDQLAPAEQIITAQPDIVKVCQMHHSSPSHL
jgi:hypothetical protein